jgi:hypothetical protein
MFTFSSTMLSTTMTFNKSVDVDITTVCFTNLDQGSEMIIFESILIAFKETVIFRGRWQLQKLAQA